MVQFTSSVNCRLDHFLKTHHFQNCSRSQIADFIKCKNVIVNKSIVGKPSYSVKVNDIIQVNNEIKTTLHQSRDSLPSVNIVFEDENFAVINKEINTVVHSGSGNEANTLVDALIAKYGIDGLSEARGKHEAGIVHRLDKDTGGLMLIAKTQKGFQSLTEQIQSKTCVRKYLCLCYGRIMPAQSKVESWITKRQKNRTHYYVTKDPDEFAKFAVMDYKALKYIQGKFTLTEVTLETGRKHQIRVQMQHIGYPIIGDQKYLCQNSASFLRLNAAERDLAATVGHQLLYSYKLEIVSPTTGKTLKFEMPIPKEINDFIGKVTE